MTITDEHGNAIEVGTRVHTAGDPGTVTAVIEDETGVRIRVSYDDGVLDTWIARWNGTGPWDDGCTEFTCDDVEVVS